MLRKYSIAFFLLSITQLVSAQFNEQWHQTINGQGDFSDRYTCITSDQNGNVYVGGSTVNTNQSLDFMLACFDQNGNLQWRKTWNGTGNGPDEANAIVFADGKLFATGYLNSTIVGNDFFTVALSSAGDSLWGAVYNETMYNQYEQANAITVDGSGNVIVSGESDRDPTSMSNDDFLTIKYNADGVQQWVARFNNIGNATDRSAAVVCNAAGDVYVTGRSDNGNDDDYVTIKYNTSGVQQWIQSFDNGGTDRSTDMGIDGNGNIYVTGRSDNGNDDDFRTIKYSSGGLELVNIIYDFVEDDRADFIDVNDDGSFVIAGRSDGNATIALNYNYRVVKYNSGGTQQWTATYDGPASNDDIVRGLDLNNDGSVLVTGYSDNNNTIAIQNDIVSILYNSNGSAVWTKTYSNPAGFDDMSNGCAFDDSGNALIAAQSENSNAQRDALFIRYTPSGTESDYSFDGAGDNGDNVRELALDNNGNIFLVGYSVSKDTDRNMFVCKLNSAGDTLWTRQISGTLFGSDEEANALLVDPSGNVIISGYVKNSGSSSDIVMAKYNTNGTQLWSSVYNGTMNESDRSYDIVSDNAGNIYITGKTDINNSPLIVNDQVFTAKYNANGLMQWTQIYTGGTGSERGRFIKIGASGNVYVIGRQFNGTDDDFLIIKYSSTGQQLWAETFAGLNGNDDPRDAEIDANENIYVTGTSESTLNSGITDAYTLAVDQNGTLLWSNNYNGAGDGIDVAEGISISTDGKTFITGYADVDASAGINNNLVTICYDSAGGQLWFNEYEANAGNDDVGDDIAVDASGNVIVASHSNTGTVSDVDYALVMFALNPQNGASIQTGLFSISDSIDVCNVININNGSIYLGGSTWSQNGQRDILVVKYNLSTGIEELNSENQVHVYPIPCEENLTVKSLIPGTEFIIISDMEGRVVQQEKSASGQTAVDVSKLAPGVYHCRVGNQSESITKMFIKK